MNEMDYPIIEELTAEEAWERILPDIDDFPESVIKKFGEDFHDCEFILAKDDYHITAILAITKNNPKCPGHPWIWLCGERIPDKKRGREWLSSILYDTVFERERIYPHLMGYITDDYNEDYWKTFARHVLCDGYGIGFKKLKWKGLDEGQVFRIGNQRGTV